MEYGTQTLPNLLFRKSEYPIGFLRYDKYKPKPEQRKNTCTPAPPKAAAFENKPSKEEILQLWKDFKGVPQELELPSAPKQFIHYFEEDDRPQAKLDRNLEGGMAVSTGRLREDTQYDYKFVCLSHNTLRGAAGGGVLLAELLAAKGYFD